MAATLVQPGPIIGLTFVEGVPHVYNAGTKYLFTGSGMKMVECYYKLVVRVIRETSKVLILTSAYRAYSSRNEVASMVMYTPS
jgi:hypothetical protein